MDQNRQSSNKDMSQDVSQREKHQAQLFSCYNQAVKLLKLKKLDQGQIILQKILNSDAIQQLQVRRLKKSVILSLANCLLIRQQKPQALAYLYLGLQQQRRIRHEQQQQQSQQLIDTNRNTSQQYMLLMRMYDLCRQLDYRQQTLYLLKSALIVSPGMWREQLLGLLDKGYREMGRKEELEDLVRLRANGVMMRKIIREEQKHSHKRSKHPCSSQNYQAQPSYQRLQQHQMVSESYDQQKSTKSILKQLKIIIPTNQTVTLYSRFQYLLTVCYVLLKCQHERRNFNKKRYLHKKYDSNNKHWMAFLNNFDLTKTKLAIVYEPLSQTNKMDEESQQSVGKNPKPTQSEKQPHNQDQLIIQQRQDQSLSQVNQQSAQSKPLIIDEKSINLAATTPEQMIQQLTTQLLRIKYTKKKKSNKLQQQLKQKEKQKQKQKSKLMEQEQQPSLPLAKGTSKKYSGQQWTSTNKTVYESVGAYLKELEEKNSLNRQQLMWLKDLNGEMYEKLWRNILQKQQDMEENQAVGIDGDKRVRVSTVNHNTTISGANKQTVDKQLLKLDKDINANKGFDIEEKRQQPNVINEQKRTPSTIQEKKLSPKDKKELQLRKIGQLDQIFAQFIQAINSPQKQSESKFNCQTLIVNITRMLINLSKQKDQQQQSKTYRHQVSYNFTSCYSSIGRLLAKCLLKCHLIDNTWINKSFIQNQSIQNHQPASLLNGQNNSYQVYHNKLFLLDILVEQFEYMSLKPAKQTEFTLHQKRKIESLKQYIEESFSVTSQLLAKQREQQLAVAYFILNATEKLIVFYSTVNNYSGQMLKFYKQVWRAHYVRLNKTIQKLSSSNRNQSSHIINNEPKLSNVYDQSLKKFSSYCKWSNEDQLQQLIKQREEKMLIYSQLLSTNNNPTGNTTVQQVNTNSFPQQQQLPKQALSEIDTIFSLLADSSQPEPSNKQNPTTQLSVLQRIITYFEQYFTKIDIEAEQRQQFSLKYLQTITRTMRIQQLITKLYGRFRSASSTMIVRQFQLLSANKQAMLIGLMLKLVVLCVMASADDCLRIVFYLTNLFLKKEEQKQSNLHKGKQQPKPTNQSVMMMESQQMNNKNDNIVEQTQVNNVGVSKLSTSNQMVMILPQTILSYKLIILYKSIIDFSAKRHRLQSYPTVFKKLYENIMGKNLHLLYQSTRQQWGYLLKYQQLHQSKSHQQQQKQKQRNQPAQQEENNLLKQHPSQLLQEENREKNLQNPQSQMVQEQTNKQQHHKDQKSPNIQFEHNIDLENYLALHSQLNPILHELYHSLEFQYQPKRIEDSIAYFLYLSRYFYEEFQLQQEIELSSHVIKMFRKCYSLFNQKLSETISHCKDFKAALIKIDRYFDGQDKQSQEIINVLKGTHKVCSCCDQNTLITGFDYSEICYILAKLFQSNPQIQDISNSTNNNILLQSSTQLDEEYYKQYLLLNVKQARAWRNYVRIQSKKAFIYFDSLVGVDPIEKYKNKFLYTKRLLSFVKLYMHYGDCLEKQQKDSNLPVSVTAIKSPIKPNCCSLQQNKNKIQFDKLRSYSLRMLNTLNVLKIKEREFLMVLKEDQWVGCLSNGGNSGMSNILKSKELREVKKKYEEGLKSIGSKYESDDQISSLYLHKVEVQIAQIKYLLGSFPVKKREYLELRIKKDQANTQKDDSKKLINRLLEQVENMISVIDRVRLLRQSIVELISKLALYEKKREEYALHLQEDLVVEFYILLCGAVQKMVDLSLTIRSTVQNQLSIKNQPNSGNPSLECTNKLQILQILKNLNQRIGVFGVFCQQLIQEATQISCQQKYRLVFRNETGDAKFKIQQTANQLHLPQGKEHGVSQLQIIAEQGSKPQQQNKQPLPSQREQEQQIQNLIQQQEDQFKESKQPQQKRQAKSKFRFMPLNNTIPAQIDDSNNVNNSKANLNKIGSKGSNNSINASVPKKPGANHKKPLQPLLDVRLYYCEQSSIAQLINDEDQFFGRLITNSNVFVNAVSVMFRSLPKHQLKRYKYRHSVTQALLCVSKLYLNYSNQRQFALEIIKDYFNIRSDDIVFVFTHSDRSKPTEKNKHLAQYYTRLLPHNLSRYQFIKHIIGCFYALKNIENLVVLIRKLNKLMVVDQNKQIQYLVTLYFYAVSRYLLIVKEIATKSQLQQRYEKLLLQFKNKIRKSLQIRVDFKKIELKCQQQIQRQSERHQKPQLLLSSQKEEVQGQKQQQGGGQQEHLQQQHLESVNSSLLSSMIKQTREKMVKQSGFYNQMDRFIRQYEEKYERKVKIKKSKKQRQLQKELRQKEKFKQKDGVIEKQMVKQMEKQRQEQMEKQKQINKQMEKQMEKQRQEQMEKQKQIYKQMEKQKQRQEQMEKYIQKQMKEQKSKQNKGGQQNQGQSHSFRYGDNQEVKYKLKKTHNQKHQQRVSENKKLRNIAINPKQQNKINIPSQLSSIDQQKHQQKIDQQKQQQKINQQQQQQKINLLKANYQDEFASQKNQQMGFQKLQRTQNKSKKEQLAAKKSRKTQQLSLVNTKQPHNDDNDQTNQKNHQYTHIDINYRKDNKHTNNNISTVINLQSSSSSSWNYHHQNQHQQQRLQPHQHQHQHQHQNQHQHQHQHRHLHQCKHQHQRPSISQQQHKYPYFNHQKQQHQQASQTNDLQKASSQQQEQKAKQSSLKQKVQQHMTILTLQTTKQPIEPNNQMIQKANLVQQNINKHPNIPYIQIYDQEQADNIVDEDVHIVEEVNRKVQQQVIFHYYSNINQQTNKNVQKHNSANEHPHHQHIEQSQDYQDNDFIGENTKKRHKKDC